MGQAKAHLDVLNDGVFVGRLEVEHFRRTKDEDLIKWVVRGSDNKVLDWRATGGLPRRSDGKFEVGVALMSLSGGLFENFAYPGTHAFSAACMEWVGDNLEALSMAQHTIDVTQLLDIGNDTLSL